MADTSAESAKRIWCSVSKRVQLHRAMLALQFGYAEFHVVSRAALNMGISKNVFIVYRNIIAFLLLAPFAYFLEKPAITLNFLVQFFLLALFGITANQGFYLLGLDNTSLHLHLPFKTWSRPLLFSWPPYSSKLELTTSNICHCLTMLVSNMIEKVRLDRKDGLAKVLGMAFCNIGASVITLYKGPVIYNPKPPLHVASPTWQTTLALRDAAGKNWTLGCVYLIGHYLSWSGWLVLQALVLKKYPARLSVTSYTYFFGLVQFLIISTFIERNSNAWLVHTRAEVFSIFYAVRYSNLVASGIAFAVQIWCIDRGGPVFVAMYQPVQTLVVTIMASMALGEQFYLGGSGPIIAGLYLVLWGKNEERKFALEKAAIQSAPEHGNSRPPAHIKAPSLPQPLLLPSTENV
ncbi:hypothetical protein ACJRO7_023537 [Eucalyptus globulus]|uniref:WAT1-related protein n=1 Tax=Eucalyptus globulus TaxID=34317 RepID=A0ABD3K290_EUCGL